MHPALWKLRRLTNKAAYRQLLRGAKTIRGAIVLLFLIVGLGLSGASTIGLTLWMRSPLEEMKLTGAAGPYLPLVILALFLQSVLGRNGGMIKLHFSPAEV